MSLKSFPNNAHERQLIWCLSGNTIDKALKDEKSKELLLTQNLTIVQVPLSRFAKKKSLELTKLDEQGLIKEDQILVVDENSLTKETKYLYLEELVENFLDSNLTRANNYARFFAAIGATEFIFKHENKDLSEYKSNLNVNIDGMASKISDVDVELRGHIDSTLDEVASISKKFIQIECDRTERIRRAENILEECNLKNDKICSKELAAYKDGSVEPRELIIKMSSNSQQSKSLDMILNLGLKIPSLNEDSSNISLASFKSKLEIVKLVKKTFDFNLIVKF